ncbi:hypothetical protein NPIL_34001 [Nephila pilipes]|uniref:Uncharacterized protein n=1 Tax=Nephila pilipes TaxID=299642 RepID=A0A8X6TUK2_NEPPI|nr:hypothetical protein NPIL_34001 [Nephila pilipes]
MDDLTYETHVTVTCPGMLDKTGHCWGHRKAFELDITIKEFGEKMFRLGILSRVPSAHLFSVNFFSFFLEVPGDWLIKIKNDLVSERTDSLLHKGTVKADLSI